MCMGRNEMMPRIDPFGSLPRPTHESVGAPKYFRALPCNAATEVKSGSLSRALAGCGDRLSARTALPSRRLQCGVEPTALTRVAPQYSYLQNDRPTLPKLQHLIFIYCWSHANKGAPAKNARRSIDVKTRTAMLRIGPLEKSKSRQYTILHLRAATLRLHTVLVPRHHRRPEMR
ncbi:hypothetical protein FA13DRAFT_1711973 [Coprinellus micaceus]|uniref:Uncharacterized protein n=1 Tax=Coprinellus micaceus TaxID=71717 RepID=A0A4Y7T1W5_COPMI|nr:hypothetical protein FA13DRAFT_1711973 [Coprinellus micaceus]